MYEIATGKPGVARPQPVPNPSITINCKFAGPLGARTWHAVLCSLSFFGHYPARQAHVGDFFAKAGEKTAWMECVATRLLAAPEHRLPARLDMACKSRRGTHWAAGIHLQGAGCCGFDR
jgi:hypothetical protein